MRTNGSHSRRTAGLLTAGAGFFFMAAATFGQVRLDEPIKPIPKTKQSSRQRTLIASLPPAPKLVDVRLRWPQ